MTNEILAIFGYFRIVLGQTLTLKITLDCAEKYLAIWI